MRSLLKNTKNLLPAIASSLLSGRTLNAASYGILVHFAGLKSAKAIAMPLYAQIEPTINCNLACSMCPVSLRKGAYSHDDLSLGDFKKIVDKIPSALHIQIQGWGEPLLNRDIIGMISYCKSKGIRATMVTNGQLLTHEMGLRILDSGLDAIGISVDGASKKTYERLRPGASFERLLSNVKLLVKNRKWSKSKMKIFLMVVMMKENIYELSGIVELASELGVDGLRCQHVQFKPGGTEANVSRSLFFGDNLEAAKVEIRRASELARKRRLDCFVQKLEKSGNLACHWPWAGIYVSHDGRVEPCCNIVGLSLGSISHDDLQKIYNSEEYKKFRAGHASGSLPAQCKNCTYAYYNGEMVVL